MRRALVGVCAVALLAGCGNNGHARRDAVNAYFDQVDRAQAKVAAQQTRIDAAFARFSLQGNTPAELRALRRAQALLADAWRGVAAVEPPPDARPLHVKLVRMLKQETDTTAQLNWTAAFLPSFRAALAPVGPAAVALRAGLPNAHSPKTIAAVFAGYRGTLERVDASLAALRPPPLFRPVVAGDRTTLARDIAACRRAEAALRAGRPREADAAIRTLFAGAAATDTQAQQQRAARAYEARLRQIQQLGIAVAQERLRLVRSVG